MSAATTRESELGSATNMRPCGPAALLTYLAAVQGPGRPQPNALRHPALAPTVPGAAGLWNAAQPLLKIEPGSGGRPSEASQATKGRCWQGVVHTLRSTSAATSKRCQAMRTRAEARFLRQWPAHASTNTLGSRPDERRPHGCAGIADAVARCCGTSLAPSCCVLDAGHTPTFTSPA